MKNDNQQTRQQVPCNGCTACCQNDAVRLMPELGDDVYSYETEPHNIPTLASQGVRMLAHQPDGRCVYLTDQGCSIHHRAPVQCREFDCRQLVQAVGYTGGRNLVKQGRISNDVFQSGLRLIRNEQGWKG